MNFELELLNNILKNGEEIDVYKVKNDIYHKILYNNTIYLIIENKKGIKILEDKEV